MVYWEKKNKGGLIMPIEPRTLRGRNSRERILTQASLLIAEKGAINTSLDDICEAASVGKSQLYHYFANKDDLILAVIGRQTAATLEKQQPLLMHLDSWERLEQWVQLAIQLQEEQHCIGGCLVGSLASELSDQNEQARLALVRSFDMWERYLVDGFASMQRRRELRADADPSELASVLITSLQGGVLLTQTRKTVIPLQRVLHAALTYARSFATSSEML
jgi:TetR/AcrR family transcriptional repressor of nem operon